MIETTLLKNNFVINFRSFYELMKPRVMSLVIFTCVVGLIIAPQEINIMNATFSLIAVAIGAGSAGGILAARLSEDHTMLCYFVLTKKFLKENA